MTMLNSKFWGTAALALALMTTSAFAAEVTDELCTQDLGIGSCDEGICDIASVLGTCTQSNPKQCQCVTGAQCLTDNDCPSSTPNCDTTTWACVATTAGDTSGSGSDSGSGCSTSVPALAGLIPAMLAVARRRSRK
jgi:hypothetical protein